MVGGWSKGYIVGSDHASGPRVALIMGCVKCEFWINDMVGDFTIHIQQLLLILVGNSERSISVRSTRWRSNDFRGCFYTSANAKSNTHSANTARLC